MTHSGLETTSSEVKPPTIIIPENTIISENPNWTTLDPIRIIPQQDFIVIHRDSTEIEILYLVVVSGNRETPTSINGIQRWGFPKYVFAEGKQRCSAIVNGIHGLKTVSKEFPIDNKTKCMFEKGIATIWKLTNNGLVQDDSANITEISYDESLIIYNELGIKEALLKNLTTMAPKIRIRSAYDIHTISGRLICQLSREYGDLMGTILAGFPTGRVENEFAIWTNSTSILQNIVLNPLESGTFQIPKDTRTGKYYVPVSYGLNSIMELEWSTLTKSTKYRLAIDQSEFWICNLVNGSFASKANDELKELPTYEPLEKGKKWYHFTYDSKIAATSMDFIQIARIEQQKIEDQRLEEVKKANESIQNEKRKNQALELLVQKELECAALKAKLEACDSKEIEILRSANEELVDKLTKEQELNEKYILEIDSLKSQLLTKESEIRNSLLSRDQMQQDFDKILILYQKENSALQQKIEELSKSLLLRNP